MNINEINDKSFIIRIIALLIVVFIVKYLGIFKKWNKTKTWVKFFYLISISVLVYIFFCNPYKKENFGNPSSCTYYYMNNCGHCTKFTPEWDSFNKSYNGPIKLRKVEMNDAGDDLEKYNVKGFPTVIMIDEEGSVKEYDGPRTSDGLNNFFSTLGN